MATKFIPEPKVKPTDEDVRVAVRKFHENCELIGMKALAMVEKNRLIMKRVRHMQEAARTPSSRNID